MADKKSSSINVGNILLQPNLSSEFELEFAFDEDFDLQTVGVDAGSEIFISGELRSISEGIVFQGTVKVPKWEICGGCGTKTDSILEAPVGEFFAFEQSEDEDYFVEADAVDFLPLVRDLVGDTAEFSPRCAKCAAEGYKKVELGADPDNIDPRFAALKNYSV